MTKQSGPFSELVRMLRVARRWTKGDQRLPISASLLQKIENQNYTQIKATTLRLLATALARTPDERAAVEEKLSRSYEAQREMIKRGELEGYYKEKSRDTKAPNKSEREKNEKEAAKIPGAKHFYLHQDPRKIQNVWDRLHEYYELDLHDAILDFIPNWQSQQAGIAEFMWGYDSQHKIAPAEFRRLSDFLSFWSCLDDLIEMFSVKSLVREQFGPLFEPFSNFFLEFARFAEEQTINTRDDHEFIYLLPRLCGFFSASLPSSSSQADIAWRRTEDWWRWAENGGILGNDKVLAIAHTWRDGSREIIDPFFEPTFDDTHRCWVGLVEKPAVRLLYFFRSCHFMALDIKSGLVNNDLLADLLFPSWQFYDAFVESFVDTYKLRATDFPQATNYRWLSTVPHLNNFFKNYVKSIENHNYKK